MNKVKVTEPQPGVIRYQPEHKSGVLDAIKSFCKGKKPHRRKGRPIGRAGKL